MRVPRPDDADRRRLPRLLHALRPGRDAREHRPQAPKIGAVLRGIRARAPLARIVLVGYPDVLPRTGNGCRPVVPLSADDVRYFDGLIVRTNEMLATQAAANDVEFADTYRDSVGHDVCTLPGTRWFEGLVPTAVAFPLHPNELGMASMARSVLRVVAAPRSRSKRTIAALARHWSLSTAWRPPVTRHRRRR
jgi:GDSL-like Lipase/Acylhydrolase family